MRRVYTVLFLLLSGSGVMADEVMLQHDGLSLNGELVLAEERDLSAGVILILHGTLGHNGMEIIATLQLLFAENDKNSLAINLSLDIDDRHGFYPCDGGHTHTQEDAIAELGAWTAWLGAKGAEDIVLLGHSRGGNQIARFVIDSDPDVVAAILIAPPSSHETVPGQAGMLQAAAETSRLNDVAFLHCRNATVSGESYLSYYGPGNRGDTVALLANIDIPVLVFAGSEDTVVPGLTEKMVVLMQDNIVFEEIDGADHFFRDLYSDDIVEISLEFLDEL
jgi:pimeloyl-ACP methyl ester carboxylesterase